MPRRREDFTCVICLDSLFDARDDLDDVIPTVATLCGHVFHRPCIDAATKASCERWLTTQRDLDPETTYTSSDAPAECPSCRSEIFADEDSGELEFIKLYLSESQNGGGGTQLGSSSPRRRTADEPLYSLARRAKSVNELTDRLSVQSQAIEVHSSLSKAKSVVEDGMSDRAFATVRNHLQSLAASITALTNTLRSSPLIPELQTAYAVLEGTVTAERRTYRRLKDTEMPAAIRAAVHTERTRMGEIVKEERAEKERLRMELDREKAARKAAAAGWEDRVSSLKREVDVAQRALRKEIESQQETERRLRERTALVKTYQAKLDSRKHLKDNLKVLEAANASLQRQLDESGKDRPRTLPAAIDTWSDDALDQSVLGEEDSLEVDLPMSSPPPVRHPTARVIPCHVRAPAAGVAKRKQPEDTVLQPTSRLNPFLTTKSAGEKKKTLAVSTLTPSAKKKPRRSVIDLTETSPDEAGPSRQHSKFFAPAVESPLLGKRPSALADQLGIRDVHGRPAKGVASGPRVSRR